MIGRLVGLGPFFFGIGFIAPVIAAMIASFGIQLPAGIEPIYVGLVLGAISGFVAMRRGTWLW